MTTGGKTVRAGWRVGHSDGGGDACDAAELREHFAGLAERGAERVYVWFTDFAAPETLAAFGHEVIAPLR